MFFLASWLPGFLASWLPGFLVAACEVAKVANWRGINPSAKGRHWAIPRRIVVDAGEDMSQLTQHQKLDRLFELGYIKIHPGQAWPMYQHYLKPSDGVPAPDIWPISCTPRDGIPID